MSIKPEEHLGLARKIAGEVGTRWGLGPADEDLYSVGCLAMCRAAGSYRPESGVKQSTYLATVMKHAMLDWIVTDSKPIRIPRSTLKQVLELAKRDKTPTREEAKRILGKNVSPLRYAQLRGAMVAHEARFLGGREEWIS